MLAFSKPIRTTKVSRLNIYQADMFRSPHSVFLLLFFHSVSLLSDGATVHPRAGERERERGERNGAMQK